VVEFTTQRSRRLKNETGLFSPVSEASRCEAVTSQHGAAGSGSFGRNWQPLVDPAPANVKGAKMQTVTIEQLTGQLWFHVKVSSMPVKYLLINI
jgi:hypothetical protein